MNFDKTPALQLPAIAKPHTLFVQLYDAEVYCEISGREDAPALILLHGNGENLQIFNPQIRYLSQYYRVIAVDTRAHGQSTRGVTPLNFYTFADDLLCVLESLKIDKAHIVGFSDGAITALHLALTAHDRILSMVLIGANFNPIGIKLISRLHILVKYGWLSLASIFSAKMLRRKEIWGLMVNQPNLTIEELSRITAPTLVITGERDLVCQCHNDKLSRAITGSKKLIIEGGNHFWMFKQPEVLNYCILEFCKT